MSNLTFSDFGLRGMLRDNFYSNTLRTDDDVKRNIQDVVSSVVPSEILRAVNNGFVIYDACVEAEGKNFQHLLYIW